MDTKSLTFWKLLSLVLAVLLVISILHHLSMGNVAYTVAQQDEPPTPSTSSIDQDLATLHRTMKTTLDRLRTEHQAVAEEVQTVKKISSNLRTEVKGIIPKPPSPPPPPPLKGPAPNDWEEFREPSADDEKPTPSCASTRNSSESQCQWVFKRYIPSAFEALWWENIDSVQSNPCAHVKNEPFKQYYETYREDCRSNPEMMGESIPNRQECDCSKSSDPQAWNDTVYSRFEFENSCTHTTKYSFIEPLAGILRHPEFCYAGHPLLRKKRWLVFDQWDIHKNDHVFPKKRGLYFDGGASTWFSGGEAAAWFDGVYGQKCQTFDGYWLWEERSYDPVRIYMELPARVKPRYHWYNIPAVVDKSHGDSILYHLKSQTKQEDYVVFKLDMDDNELEVGVLEQMLANPDILQLVDDFYWEHHVNKEPYSWKAHPPGKGQKTAIELLRQLRQRGVRAHTWV